MIRVLIAEDSAVTREYLAHLLGEDPEITIVGMARDGEQAVALAEELRPDAIVMDVHMPVLDGFDATRRIMATVPTPIVMATASSSQAETRGAFEALEAGALILVDKPSGPGDPGHLAAARELVRTVKLMAEVKVVRHWAPAPKPAAAPSPAFAGRALPRIVAIGASTGGPQVLSRMLGELPATLAVPVLLVQHIAAEFIGGFVAWLDSTTALHVKLAEAGERPQPGAVYVGGAGAHLGLAANGRIRLDGGAPVNGFRPSVSRLFESVAAACGAEAIGVLLTGMGRDGADGLARLRAAGAVTVAQDAQSSVVFGMPGEAVRLGAAQRVLAPAAIAALLRSFDRVATRP